MSEPGHDNVTVRRMLVGSRLRRLREVAGVTREQAGYVIRASESKMSRLELGRVSFKERDVADLLDVYGVADPTEREAILELAREAGTGGRWREYEDVLPGWFANFVALEEVAVTVRLYEMQFVPGLLQTPEYARAVISAATPAPTPAAAERAVALRMARQKILSRSEPPKVWVVIDETALRRPVLDEQVFSGQLKHLLALASTPHVALQVLPLRAGVVAPTGGPFTLLRFADPDLADVVYIEQLLSAVYLDRVEQVERYAELMNQLTVQSLTPQDTEIFLADLLAGR